LNLQTVTSGACWSTFDRYRPLITAGCVGGDFSQTAGVHKKGRPHSIWLEGMVWGDTATC